MSSGGASRDEVDGGRRLEGPPGSGSRRRLLLAFALVALGSVAATVFAIARTLAIERQANFLVENVLTSVRLINRIDLDLDNEYLLIDREIYESEPAAIAAIESERRMVVADRVASTEAYEPWISFPGEAETWARVKAQIQELEAPASKAIELARSNRDAEAQEVLKTLRPRLDFLRNDLQQLVVINDEGATRSLARISGIRSQLFLTFLGIGLVTVIGTCLLGRWSIRQVERREAEARRYARVLEERNRGLDAFAGHVAHDMRGPLASLHLAATLLSQRVPAESATTDKLHRGVRQMESLIEDLLVLARAEAVHGSCDPAAVAATIQEEFADRVRAEQGTLRVAVAPARVRCSDGLLHQALANLLENAVKFRRAGVELQVEVSGAVVGGEYELRVTDNGLGMSSCDAARVFEPFYRAPRTRSLPGTGLGLAIVKRVVDASGGAASVTSQPGEGTTFLLRLPLVTRETPPPGEPAAAG